MINGFDERSYAEASHFVTIFNKPCKVPNVSSRRSSYFLLLFAGVAPSQPDLLGPARVHTTNLQVKNFPG